MKLTPSQLLIRQLLNVLPVKTIASELGYKSTSSLYAYSRGVRKNLKPSTFQLAQKLYDDNVTRKTIPSHEIILKRQKRLRETDIDKWVRTTYKDFIKDKRTQFKIYDEAVLLKRLERLSLSYYYYNAGVEAYLITNKATKKFPVSLLSGFFFQLHFHRQNAGHLINEYAIFTWYSLIERKSDTWKGLSNEVYNYMEMMDNEDRYANEFSEQYEFLAKEHDVNFLAFISVQ